MSTVAFGRDQSDRAQRTNVVNGEPQPYWNQVFWAGIATAPCLAGHGIGRVTRGPVFCEPSNGSGYRAKDR